MSKRWSFKRLTRWWMVVLLCLPIEVMASWRPTTLIIFGDSLSDNGNKYAAMKLPISPPYWEGRYSNGPVWIELLAFQFGLIPDPYTHPGYLRNQQFLDYAFGDSVILSEDINPARPTRLLKEEVASYLKEHPSEQTADALVVIWEGANDLKARSCLTHLATCLKQLRQEQLEVITLLYQQGIRHFLILNIPNLGMTPQAHRRHSAWERVKISYLIDRFNRDFAKQLHAFEQAKAGIDLQIVDVNQWMKTNQHLFKEPLSTPCYENQDRYDIVSGSVCPLSEQPNYFFWDWIHPSAVAHQQFAQDLRKHFLF